MEKERKTPSRDHVVLSRNPFAQVNREHNFPGLDRALGIDSNAKTSTQRQQQQPSPDESVCSQQTSSSFPASSLDMSIGARAALNEHLRHVALHGLDGHRQPPLSASSADTSFERLPQDEVWDRLLDGVDNLSITSSACCNSPNRTPTTTSLLERLQPVVSVVHSEDGDHEAVEVEVVADVSSDYFNSSTIWQLATPEKNKTVRRSVTTRGGAIEDGSLHGTDSDIGSQQSGNMMYLYNVALGMHEQANETTTEHSASFISLGVDLSRISNSDVSDIRSSPDEAPFYQHHRQGGSMFAPEDYVPREHVLTSPRRRCSPPTSRDCSFSTPSRRRGGNGGGLPSPEASALFSTSNHSGCMAPGSGIERDSSLANLSADIGLSPIAAQAGSIAVKLGRPSRRHHPGDAFPAFSPSTCDGTSPNSLELVESIQGMRMDEPSPISRANSGIDLRNFPVGENCILDMDDRESASKGASQSSPRLKPRDSFQTRQASSLNTTSDTNTTNVLDEQQGCSSGSLEGKRRYRTVVPARVFMDDPDNFPVQDDSFSAQTTSTSSTSGDPSSPLSSSSSSRLQARSLLVSFNAADEFEVPLTDS